MENSISIPVQPIEQCGACRAKILNDDIYCANCGYPIRGSVQEQQDFVLKRDMAEIDMAGFNKRLKKAGNTLYYLAFFFVFSGVVTFFVRKNDPEVLGVVIPLLILATVFLALGWYSRKRPLASIVSGLCLYVIALLLMFINNPASIAYGLLFKIIIIGYLIKGIKSAIEIEKIKKEHNLA
jgi:hypothetical protein